MWKSRQRTQGKRAPTAIELSGGRLSPSGGTGENTGEEVRINSQELRKRRIHVDSGERNEQGETVKDSLEDIYFLNAEAKRKGGSGETNENQRELDRDKEGNRGEKRTEVHGKHNQEAKRNETEHEDRLERRVTKEGRRRKDETGEQITSEPKHTKGATKNEMEKNKSKRGEKNMEKRQ